MSFRKLANYALMAGLAGLMLVGSGCAAKNSGIQVGPRPYYLVNDLDDGKLKTELKKNQDAPLQRTDFSIGHRGACMQFPEHTKESYEAAARMGAGICECDVTFTKDRELVCRHSQCDLATTTNILLIPELAAKCSQPFQPAEYDPDGKLIKPASAKCCTSDITLAEFKQLQGKMDASNPKARSVAEFLDATPSWRTDRYSGTGTLMTHAESIELFKKLGMKMTPELKEPSVAMPFQGDYTQQQYAQQMIDEYKAAGVEPKNVFAQSFNLEDVKYWLKNDPDFGKQAVFLDDRYDDKGFDYQNPATWSPSMKDLVADGVRIIAPPLWMLVTVENGKIVPSVYAKEAKAAGLDLIAWSFERSGLLKNGGGWYYQSVKDIVTKDADTLVVLNVLAEDVGVIGVFSDWPGTVTYFANKKGLK
ncbi:glycerophosphodiester phosphodiesterase family protein [Maridesulfovibrio salexigens]|uniref:glycerophosphodiester phosphodiesterase n=1 Tax=Maridesulfovibrio salexigens (strain ATCC 14822 / DSM 2638 / NCIMB 8403 / VKM B-1763) TaxID=526222 RepID=C6C1N6_MARSD|nr:glycerophosphodiester phosphodiesterase family protein [Maridesulfovibrio salexigens]ACS81211.1 glycerophosphoryl diester phosphodiesterase [Maridesulfovibrio salexigens DSM 2638]